MDGDRKLNPAAFELRKEIVKNARNYFELVHGPKPFVPGKSKIHYSGRVFSPDEMENLINSSLDMWLTLDKYGDEFEEQFAKFFGVHRALFVNSGSSANLVAVSSLMSERFTYRMKPGDEVITPAATFPTTLNPIIQNNLVPVFADVELGTYNINPDLLEKCVSEKTRAIMVPHTLGIPCDLDVIMELVRKHNLFLIEDTCDALGTKWDGKYVGTFGDFGTVSLYPAHHMTTGEGGIVHTDSKPLAAIAESFRDWGRACWCKPGEPNPDGACGARFKFSVAGIPYDHKYMYSNIGYNLKPTDLQAAVGVAQFKKLPGFIEKRKHNFSILYEALKDYERWLVLPRWHEKADVSWFAFPITVKENVGFSKQDLTFHLEKNLIETRAIFSGNILEHQSHKNIKRRIVGTLENSNRMLKDSFFIGVYPGITDEMLDYMIKVFRDFFKNRT